MCSSFNLYFPNRKWQLTQFSYLEKPHGIFRGAWLAIQSTGCRAEHDLKSTHTDTITNGAEYHSLHKPFQYPHFWSAVKLFQLFLICFEAMLIKCIWTFRIVIFPWIESLFWSDPLPLVRHLPYTLSKINARISAFFFNVCLFFLSYIFNLSFFKCGFLCWQLTILVLFDDPCFMSSAFSPFICNVITLYLDLNLQLTMYIFFVLPTSDVFFPPTYFCSFFVISHFFLSLKL